jgi:hypothetical protein
MAANEGMALKRIRFELPSRRRGRISRPGVLVEIVIVLACVVLLNFYPERVGFWLSAGDRSSFTPILASEFSVHLPWLNTLWAISLLVALSKVLFGYWTPVLRAADFGVSLLSIHVFLQLIRGGPLLDPAAATESWPWEWKWLPLGDLGAGGPDSVLKSILCLIVVLWLIGLLQQLLALVRSRPWEQGRS